MCSPEGGARPARELRGRHARRRSAGSPRTPGAGLAQERVRRRGHQLRVPPLRLCTDNGAMIAAIGDLLVRDGAAASEPSLAAIPTVELRLAQLAA